MNLPSHGFCCFGGETNTFFRIYRVRQKDELLIYESETVFDNETPRFKKVTLSERRLCKNDPDANFDIRFYDYSSSGNHGLIGKVVTTVSKVLDSRNYPIMFKNQVQGNIKLDQVKRAIKYNFTDYISAGLQLLLITCIDFTASNGTAKAPTSLHYITPNKKSQYE